MGNISFTESPLKGAFMIDLKPFEDERGWFSRVFCKKEFSVVGHTKEWLQLNHSFTAAIGSIRGMHFQLPPYSEVKLVRCIAGEVFDVIVDLREGSPTFLNWWGITLSAVNRRMIYIPEGFAHGFQTLKGNSELLYHHTAFYNKEAERGIRYEDPALNITWPLPPKDTSSRDNSHPLLSNDFKGLKI